MKTVNFTPGPWRVEKANNANRPVICRVVDFVIKSDEIPSVQSEEADAHLIAAAPSMYEVLDRISRRLEMDIDDGSRPDQWSMEALVRDAGRAMAKARGEKQ